MLAAFWSVLCQDDPTLEFGFITPQRPAAIDFQPSSFAIWHTSASFPISFSNPLTPSVLYLIIELLRLLRHRCEFFVPDKPKEIA